MDVTVTSWINSAAGSNLLLDSIMIMATKFGVPIMVLLVVLQWWTRESRYHVRHAALSAGLSFLLGLAINQIVLLFLHRVRPYDAGVTHLLIAPSADWSFPSDHATASLSIAAAFALQRLPWRALGFLLLAVLIGWSRIYVGTHYVTDLLGGALTGMLGAILVRVLYREESRLGRIAVRIL